MEEMTVVSFFVNREGVAREKNWRYEIWENMFRSQEFEMRYIQVWLPFWREKDTMWTSETQKEYLMSMPIPPQGRKVCYICDKETSILFGLKPEPFSLEWGLFLLEYYKVDFDSLVVFEDRELDAQELVLRFAPRIPYVGVVTKERWRWEEVEEYIASEYGYQIEVGSTFTKLHPQGEKLLIWSGDEIRGLSPLTIPSGCVWLDESSGMGQSHFAMSNYKKKINRLNLEKFLHDFAKRSCIVREEQV